MDSVAVKEKGMIFGADSVRSILAGKKHQTRRVVKPQPEVSEFDYMVNGKGERFELKEPRRSFDWRRGKSKWIHTLYEGDLRCYLVDFACPYGVVGDRLWARETWATDDDKTAWYRADGETYNAGLPWRSPLFMPRWASRITLELTEVRVERLTDISEKDAVAEGCTATELSPFISADEHETARDQYEHVWDDLNARRGYPFKNSPWVWVLSFQLLTPERS